MVGVLFRGLYTGLTVVVGIFVIGWCLHVDPPVGASMYAVRKGGGGRPCAPSPAIEHRYVPKCNSRMILTPYYKRVLY